MDDVDRDLDGYLGKDDVTSKTSRPGPCLVCVIRCAITLFPCKFREMGEIQV